jgi:phosphatidylserine/phosphatidylglycerophosphate/cardiolipin synthase-like enzyme
LVDIPIEEGTRARRPPERVLPPKPIPRGRKISVQPLLTPDAEGAVYCDAVLDLINSATESLWFQIPYIAMPSKPRQRRGRIDDLIAALTDKLLNLPEARLLLRYESSAFSGYSHAAWYFKTKGVNVRERLRVISDHHTKGMIVDGERVLIGSHNWSKSGVTLNRDASLLFHDQEVAQYFAEAFEIDWDRADRIPPKRFVKESVILEAAGEAPPPGFRRVPLSELIKEAND